MTFVSMRGCVAGLTLAALSFAAPALAQDVPSVTFENFRDAVAGKYFSPAGTRARPEAPNTLEIGFDSDTDAFRVCAPSAIVVVPCNNNRVAMDTLSFDVRAPEGYYVSSITYYQEGRGAIARLADARGAASWVVAGVPMDLGGSFGGPVQFPAVGNGWSRSRTLELSDSSMTVVPVSVTTGLFAYAGPLGEASLDLTFATIAVTIRPLGPTAKKTATIVVDGFTVPYDGLAHEATGTATGADGESLTRLLTIVGSFTNVPGGQATWTFAGNDDYNAEAGTADITITPVDATIAVSGFTGTYDGLPHRATGTATGVNVNGVNEDLNHHLDLGASFTNAPGGTATWTFGGDANYNVATGAAAITINKATPILTWPQPAAITSGTALTATQLNATANVNGAFVYDPPLGTVLTATQQLSVAFTPADTVNYNGATATVTITVTADTGLQIVNPGPQTDRVGEEVRLRIRVTRASSGSGSGKDRDGVFTATGLPPGLRMDSEDGEIRGRPTTVSPPSSPYHVTVTFETARGGTVSAQFDWTILPRRKGGKD
jgi:hypothetical protein